MLATEDVVVATGTEGDRDALAQEDEGEAVAVLKMPRWDAGSLVDANLRTFSLQLRKKPMGSRPYVAAEPRKGIQCQTNGGCDLGRGILTHCLH